MCGVKMVIKSLDTSFSKIQSSGERFLFEGYQLSSDVKLREIDRGLEQKLQPVVGRRGCAI
jgi:hypothetical protein